MKISKKGIDNKYSQCYSYIKMLALQSNEC